MDIATLLLLIMISTFIIIIIFGIFITSYKIVKRKKPSRDNSDLKCTTIDACEHLFDNYYPTSSNYIPRNSENIIALKYRDSYGYFVPFTDSIRYDIINKSNANINLIMQDLTTNKNYYNLFNASLTNYNFPPNPNKIFSSECIFPYSNKYISVLYNNSLLQITANNNKLVNKNYNNKLKAGIKDPIVIKVEDIVNTRISIIITGPDGNGEYLATFTEN